MIYVFQIFLALLLISCTTVDKNRLVSLDNRQISMIYDVPRKRVELVDYNYKSHTKVYDGNVLRKEEMDNSDFKIRYDLKKDKEKITYLMKTIEKRGDITLENMAFPGLDNSIKLTINKKAEVLDAKKLDNADHVYAKDDLIYMPILALPTEKVGVGDIWELSYTWKDGRGISYTTQLRSKLVSIYECELDEICSEIDLKGTITIPDGDLLGIHLLSNVEGKMLLNTRLGSVLWSYFVTEDKLLSRSNIIESKSCLESVLSDPVVRIWKWGYKPDCVLSKAKSAPGT